MFIVTKYTHAEQAERHELFGVYNSFEDAEGAARRDYESTPRDFGVYEGYFHAVENDATFESDACGPLGTDELHTYWFIYDSENPESFEV